MKKKTYIIVISLITVACIVIGSIRFFGGYMDGDYSIFGFFSDGKTESIVKDVDLDSFSSVNITGAIMDVEIRKGDSFKLHYECNKEKFIPEYVVENGNLKITQKKSSGFTLFSFSSNAKCMIVLTVPDGTNLSDLKISSDTGDLIISDIVVEKANIETDTGDVKVNNANLGNLIADTDTGDIIFDGDTLADVKMTSDTGDITIKNSTMAGVEIESDTGDIKVACGLKMESYNASLTTDTGSVNINGKSQGDKYSVDSTDGTGLKMKMSTDTGDITVE